MPKIREICSLTNTALQQGNFKTRPFQDGKWYGLAYVVARNEGDGEQEQTVKRPAIVDTDGEGVAVDFSDTYPIQFYHRILQPIQYPDMSTDDDSFGDPAKDNKEIVEMALICVGSRKRTRANAEDIAAAIVADMPRELTSVQLQTLQLENANIEIIEVETNPDTVFEQECQGIDAALSPEDFMISVRYRLTTIYGKYCFSLCN